MGVWDHIGDVGVQARLFQHPNHAGVTHAIAGLIAELRATSERENLRKVQERLVGAIVEAERRYADAARLLKRGKGDPIDKLFWRRTCVQLRSVGDAVAWRFLNYRRRWIHLLGANPSPGFMSDKSGFDEEWQLFQDHWDSGEPTLLSGATNCIRLGDLLVAKDSVLEAIEVKRNPKKFGGKQRRRLEALVREINDGAPIAGVTGEGWVVESDVPYQSHWKGAIPQIERASSQGFAAWVPEPGLAVMFMAWRPAAISGKEQAEAIYAREQKAAALAIGGGEHSILIRSFDYPFKSRWAAPISIFPIPAESAALLMTGELTAVIEVRVEAMVDALRARGLDARHTLIGLTSADPLPARLVSWRRPRSGSVLKNTMEQLGIELTVLSSWAQALASTPPPAAAPPQWTGSMCLKGEDQVWA